MRISAPTFHAHPVGPMLGVYTPGRAIHRSMGRFSLGRFGLGQEDTGDDSGDGGDSGSGSFACSGVCPAGQAFDPDACMCQPLPLTSSGSSSSGSGTCPAAGTHCTDACGNASFQDGNCNCIPTSSACTGSSGSPVGGSPGAPCFSSGNQVGTYSSSGICSGSGSSLTPSQIAALFQGSAGVLKSLQSPYLVAGTGLVYNPATGQLVSSTAINASAISGGITSTITSLLPVLLILGAAFFILPGIMGGGKR